MPKSKNNKLAILVAIVYLIGFPFVILFSRIAMCGYATYPLIFGNLASIIAMSLLIVFTWLIIKRKPEWTTRLWFFAVVYTFLINFILFPAYAVPCVFSFTQPQPVLLNDISYHLSSLASVLVLAYVIGFGLMAIKSQLKAKDKKRRLLRITLAAIIAIMILIAISALITIIQHF